MRAYTNGNTDLALKILKVYYKYPNGDTKASYLLFNKRNGIVYHRGGSILPLPASFFKLNKIEDIQCQIS